MCQTIETSKDHLITKSSCLRGVYYFRLTKSSFLFEFTKKIKNKKKINKKNNRPTNNIKKFKNIKKGKKKEKKKHKKYTKI